jgi:hypothetical protein
MSLFDGDCYDELTDSLVKYSPHLLMDDQDLSEAEH